MNNSSVLESVYVNKSGHMFSFFFYCSFKSCNGKKINGMSDSGAAGHDKPSLDYLGSPQRDWTVLIRTCFTSNIGPVEDFRHFQDDLPDDIITLSKYIDFVKLRYKPPEKKRIEKIIYVFIINLF